MSPPPSIAIGGVGGSGTRVVADIIRQLGYELGPDLNEPLDNLWFTLLFKYRDAFEMDDAAFTRHYEIFKTAMTGGDISTLLDARLAETLLTADRANQCAADWLHTRIDNLRRPNPAPATGRWGWKEPNTHILLPQLLRAEPSLHYIHVVRSGPDMAFSPNQNQLRLWGPITLGARYEDTPRGSLRFWLWTHQRILNLQQTYPTQLHLIAFEQLCTHPTQAIRSLTQSLNHPVSTATLTQLAQTITPPATIGRHQLNQLDAADIAAAAEIARKAAG